MWRGGIWGELKIYLKNNMNLTKSTKLIEVAKHIFRELRKNQTVLQGEKTNYQGDLEGNDTADNVTFKVNALPG